MRRLDQRKPRPSGRGGSHRKPYAWRLEPVYAPPPGACGITTAAVMTCIATGRTLSGMGGGGEYLCPEVVDALRNDGTAKTVLDTADWEASRAALRAAAAGAPDAAALAAALALITEERRV